MSGDFDGTYPTPTVDDAEVAAREDTEARQEVEADWLDWLLTGWTLR